MPTYDYECEACGHHFELFQSMTARVKRKCPECGKPKLQRLIGPGAGFLFKGDGFYITDYRSDSYRSDESAAKKTSDGKDASSDKKSASGDKASKPKSPSATKGKSKGSGKKA